MPVQSTFLNQHKGGTVLTKNVKVESGAPNGNSPYQWCVRDANGKVYYHVADQVGTGEWIYAE